MKSGAGDDFRDHIATVNQEGKRIWIFPKKPKGYWYNKRKSLSYILLLFLVSAPFIRIGDEPLFLFNIIERKFILFGNIFWPQDMYLLAITLILGVVFVIFFTIIFGRIYCGWFCPQTIFMEMVFRRIGYWIEGDFHAQKNLWKEPWNFKKIAKRTLKHAIFLIISFFISHIFLAYIIGIDHLIKIQTDPIGSHLGGLIAILFFTFTFYGVFTWLKEQVCTTICPYGRLQGVLLDANSMVVAYDHKRGECRSKIHKNEDRKSAQKGDCIDCAHCIDVCPTGIDIRNGTQLECINCTACIDACDHMMDAVGMEKGLIRFVSENGIKEGTPFVWTRRVKSYSILLIALLISLTILLLTRKDIETELVRQRGSSYSINNDGLVSNIFEMSILNKTHKDFIITLNVNDKDCKLINIGKQIVLKSEKQKKVSFLIQIPNSKLEDGTKKIKINVYGNGKLMETVKTKLIGPYI
jgi:cytochrome c oxidase accessory protein FixG